MKIKSSLLSLLFLFLLSCSTDQKDFITYPYSQWTLGASGHSLTWRYLEGFEYNNSFISAPAEGQWDSWYKSIQDYRDTARTKIGRETPYLRCQFPSGRETRMHFDKFAYQLVLLPGELIRISGQFRSSGPSITLYIDFDLKTKGEEMSYLVRRQIEATDSLSCPASEDWKDFSKTIRIPQFTADSFGLVPIIRIQQSGDKTEGEIFLKDIQLHTRPTIAREKLLADMERYISRQAKDNQLCIPDDLAWTYENFVMGFVFIWDHKFWDPARGMYLVDDYCKTMEKEFGGIQSVILWHSYPNIGIDERNQFDFFHAMPGGINGLRQVVEDFHRNGVKVFITYNPWDLDTRRPESHDFKELAKIINDTGADGIFLDTWKCSKGVISIFEVENSIRDEVAKYGKNVAFTTEILPEFKDLHGPDALTSSWGQEIDPFHYTDLSHQKWLMPQHKQYYIKRMTKERKPILAHAWTNGQGIYGWVPVYKAMLHN